MRTIKLFSFGRIIAGYKGIRIRKERDWDEFRVEFLFHDGSISENDTYFTDDKQDALDTAWSASGQNVRAVECFARLWLVAPLREQALRELAREALEPLVGELR